ncbi:MAG: alpha/beta hydrolase [Paraglaciecola sp.]|nr:alpha/beta hydrolase [Paraglaciecola sp.]NCT48842.1 alpha/beta hydrolase [Paraglaciecola sp.]
MSRLLKMFFAVLCLLVVVVAVFVALNWQPDRSVEQLSARWAKPPSQFIAINGMQVHLRDEGPVDDPRPIVLLHGTSSSLHTWDAWVDALKGEHRVIRFDLPGFGLTGPEPTGLYAIEHYAAFVVAVLDQLGVEQVTLGGNSLGGYIAWATTVLYPQRVVQLILVDASGYPFEAESLPLAFKIAQTPILNKLMRFVLPRSVVKRSVENVFGDPALVTPALVDRYFEISTRAGNRGALVARFEQTQPGEFSSRVKEITVPTLILWGQLDHLIPVSLAERFHQDIANSRVAIFAELGHVPQEENPQVTVNALKRFLAEQTAQ